MTSFFVRQNTNEDDQVIKAEALFSQFIVKHNLPFAIADHFSKLVPKMFPGCPIAQKYGAGKTKTTQIVKGVNSEKLSPHPPSEVRTEGRGEYFDFVHPYIIVFLIIPYYCLIY